MIVAVARFSIVVSGHPAPRAGAPGERRFVRGRFGSLVAAAVLALVAAGVVVLALVLGYLIAGLIFAAILVFAVVSMVRGAFGALRR